MNVRLPGAFPALGLVCGFALSGCLHVATPRADVEGDAKAGLLAAEEGVMQAISARDERALEQRLAPDFVLRVPGEQDQTRADVLQRLRDLPQSPRVRGVDLQVRVEGDVGIVTGWQRATVETAAGHLEDVQAFSDVFVRRNGAWVLSFGFSVPVPPTGSP